MGGCLPVGAIITTPPTIRSFTTPSASTPSSAATTDPSSLIPTRSPEGAGTTSIPQRSRPRRVNSTFASPKLGSLAPFQTTRATPSSVRIVTMPSLPRAGLRMNTRISVDLGRRALNATENLLQFWILYVGELGIEGAWRQLARCLLLRNVLPHFTEPVPGVMRLGT